MRVLGGVIKEFLSWILDLRDIVTFYRAPEVLTAEEALKFRAVARWGDGESKLAYGGSTAFQSHSPELERELNALINESAQDLMLCFVPNLVSRRPFHRQSARYRRLWCLTVFIMRRSLRRDYIGDALMFRREGDFSGVPPLFQRLVQVQRILLVSADPNDAVDLGARLASSGSSARLSHLSVPRVEAYRVRDALLIKLKSQDPPPDITLLSAGPVGKCLIPHLLTFWPESSQILDTGHLFEHLRQDLKVQE